MFSATSGSLHPHILLQKHSVPYGRSLPVEKSSEAYSKGRNHEAHTVRQDLLFSVLCLRLSAEEVQEELMNKLMASDYVDYENEMAVKFQQAILMLPEKQRVVFNLRYYDELEYEEISRITDTKVDTLKVNYHYAKEKIKEYMINN